MANQARVHISLYSGKAGWLSIDRSGWLLKSEKGHAKALDADKTILGVNWLESSAASAVAEMGGGHFTLVYLSA